MSPASGSKSAAIRPSRSRAARADWKLTAPLSARADSVQVQRLLEILDAKSKDRYPATGLARYDLNEPYARVTINQQTFGFGAVNELSREQYVLTQDGVYPVSLRYGGALPKNALQLVSKQLFAADEAPVAFSLPDFTLTQQDGRWQLTPPAADSSADDINRWVDEWRLASASSVQPAGDRKPLATIKIKLKSGTEISVAVLQREPQLVLMRSDQPYAYELSADAAKRLLARPAAGVKIAMPELPEVETTRRGLAPLVRGATVEKVVVRNRALREPVPRNLARVLTGRRIDELERRAKYLLFRAGDGTLIVHLGMSGRLWVVAADTPPATHDHFDLALANGRVVRLRDPRRFGLVLWHTGDPLRHKLLRDIGPEPLSTALTADWLYRETRARSGAIKNALMDSHLVAGVGNIYANEALFRARINPRLPARRIGLARYAHSRRKNPRNAQ